MEKSSKRKTVIMGMVFFLLGSGFLTFEMRESVKAVSTSKSEAGPTVPKGSTYASVFPDIKLAKTVETQIYPDVMYDDLDLNLPVTQEELDQITSIEDSPWIGEDPIQEIEGVQYLPNLETLDVGYVTGFKGDTTNLDVISKLTKLKHLGMENYSLTDISGLSQLTNLTYLNLTKNRITNASPVANLTNLETLLLDGTNRISSLEPFKKLTKLKWFQLSTNQNDFRPIGDLPIFHDPTTSWRLSGSIYLPDTYVGAPVRMEAFDPLGQQVEYGSPYIPGKVRVGSYAVPYMTWTEPGEGSVRFSKYAGDGSVNYIQVNYYQTILPKPIKKGTVTVHYVDNKGQNLVEPVILTGEEGKDYQTEPKFIKGYHVLHMPSNAKGIFTSDSQTVTYVYAPTPIPIPEGAPVTVRYIDEQGKDLIAPETLTGKVGEAYSTKVKDISGYQNAERPKNAEGFFQADPQMIVYHYQKIEKGEVEPQFPALPPELAITDPVNATPLPTTPKKEVVKKKGERKVLVRALPQTGDRFASGLLVGGFMLLGLGSYFLFHRKKKQNQRKKGMES